MAKLTDFKINDDFTLQEGDPHQWRVTDVGSRTLIAIKLDQQDERNCKGPPYSIAEHVFDEYDVDHIYAINGIIVPGEQDFSNSEWIEMSPMV